MTDFNQKTHDTDVGSHGRKSRQMMEVFENQEFGSIRLLQEAGKTFFCASDVAKALGYVNPYAAVKRHCRGPLTKREGVVQRVNQYGSAGEQVVEIAFITEGDVYRLIVHSKLPSAERFEHWVFDEVLPSIRKHGVYMSDSVLDQVIQHPEVIYTLAQELVAEREQLEGIRKQLDAAQPKADYAAAKAGAAAAENTAAGTAKAAHGTASMTEKAFQFVQSHSHIIIGIAAVGLLVLVIAGSVSSCSVLINGGGNVVLGTSYTAEDEDLKGVETDYTKLEDKLRKKIDRIETDHPGYDEYRYNLAEIGHNPYELASLLTVEFENYTRSQVQARLQSIFEAQYELKLEEKVEIRTRKETRVGYRYNPITGTGHTYTYQVTVQYEYKILNVTLLNRGVDYVARNSGLTDDQLQRYEVTLECRGNRDDLFAGIAFATPDGVGSSGEYQDYDIPGEALTDEKFRKMITEAEKYLGYPYVWGGSSPSTSFDCSGFVSWVINHCGNGWNVGRQTANGLMGKCDIIPKSEAKPGDLIFFQKTYNTSGASHVGIYVGNGMMIHCGNPISYASIETNYWRQHYYCMGRIR